ncbi:hypothetical protein [Rossellomorea sp. BNER]|uniref:hypothetical protein n=1 Tax=Rossellomorea sp. BNER TaxID=2962031 RepID=UPI003AF290B5|nr:hypothetical protein [Rossellomorea sp. BNER]
MKTTKLIIASLLLCGSLVITGANTSSEKETATTSNVQTFSVSDPGSGGGGF